MIYDKVRRECLDRIGEYIGAIPAPNRDDVGHREGLEAQVIKRLLEVLEPDHPENPFQANVRFRNYLIVRLLIELGIRRGELLALYIEDMALTGAKGTVTIHRRPDDIHDDRREKPAVKTAARLLPLSGRATELVHEWVVEYRSKLPLAKRNPFLIVTIPDGRPMSLSNINKIFQAIRKRVPGLPEELGPHLLRHSWNDAFSEQIDRMGNISQENETKWRTRLMGWRGASTAQHYLRRTTRRRSNEFLAKIQEGLDIRMADDGDNS
ncbi:tyrosine-type recombinase/integrase [Agrobacterium sp. RAC06]|uniref:tyrosine-type recombinase/integrase n=1 Tax=Agrobacterium sp. RAC06 TaxID=1842536 RepID=UPI00083E4F2C|nr:site-specific integrase [Agrobacterium sp. RAC06]